MGYLKKKVKEIRKRIHKIENHGFEKIENINELINKKDLTLEDLRKVLLKLPKNYVYRMVFNEILISEKLGHPIELHYSSKDFEGLLKSINYILHYLETKEDNTKKLGKEAENIIKKLSILLSNNFIKYPLAKALILLENNKEKTITFDKTNELLNSLETLENKESISKIIIGRTDSYIEINGNKLYLEVKFNNNLLSLIKHYVQFLYYKKVYENIMFASVFSDEIYLVDLEFLEEIPNISKFYSKDLTIEEAEALRRKLVKAKKEAYILPIQYSTFIDIPLIPKMLEIPEALEVPLVHYVITVSRDIKLNKKLEELETITSINVTKILNLLKLFNPKKLPKKPIIKKLGKTYYILIDLEDSTIYAYIFKYSIPTINQINYIILPTKALKFNLPYEITIEEIYRNKPYYYSSSKKYIIPHNLAHPENLIPWLK